MVDMPAAYNCMVWWVSLPTIARYGGYRCLQLYGMVGTGHAYNSMVYLPTIIWYACLQLYGMPAYNYVLWYGGQQAEPWP